MRALTFTALALIAAIVAMGIAAPPPTVAAQIVKSNFAVQHYAQHDVGITAWAPPQLAGVKDTPTKFKLIIAANFNYAGKNALSIIYNDWATPAARPGTTPAPTIAAYDSALMRTADIRGLDAADRAMTIGHPLRQ